MASGLGSGGGKVTQEWQTRFTTVGGGDYTKELNRNASAANKLAKEIEALKDKAAFERLKKDSVEYKLALMEVSAAQGRFNNTLNKGGRGMRELSQIALVTGVNMESLAGSVSQAASAFVEMAVEGEQALAAMAQFERTGGTSADIDKLSVALGGLVPRGSIVKMANMAKSFGITGENLEVFAKSAVGASKKLGTSVEFQFDSIVTGTARASKQILDNAGIVLQPMQEIEAAYRKQTGAIGELTDRQKQLAVQMSVAAGSADNLAAAEVASADGMQKLLVNLQNLRGEFSRDIAEDLDGFTAGLSRNTRALKGLEKTEGARKVFEKHVAMAEEAGDKFNSLAEDLNALDRAYAFGIFTTEEYEAQQKALGKELEETKLQVGSAEQKVAIYARRQIEATEKTRKAEQTQREWNEAIREAALVTGTLNEALEKGPDPSAVAEDFLLKVEQGREKAERQAEEKRRARSKAARDKRKAEEKKEAEERARQTLEAETELQKIRQGALITELQEAEAGFNEIERLVELSHADLAALDKARLDARAAVFEDHFGSIGAMIGKQGTELIAENKAAALEQAEGISQAREKSLKKVQDREISLGKARKKQLKITNDLRKADEARFKAEVTSSVGIAGAIGKGVSSIIKDKQADAVISGLIETAEAAKSFAFLDIAGGISHGVAAGLFFHAASASGGSKGGGSAGTSRSGGGRARSESARKSEPAATQAAPRRQSLASTNIFISQFGTDTAVGMAMFETLGETANRNSGVGLAGNAIRKGGRAGL